MDRRTKITTALSILRSKLHSLERSTDYSNIRLEATSHLSRLDKLISHISSCITLPGTTDTCWRDVDAALEALAWMVQGSEDEWIAEQMLGLRGEREEVCGFDVH